MIFAALICAVSAAQSAPASKGADTRLFEMRVYYAMPGKLDDLNARFRNHTLKLFARHGMTNIGYWTPIDNTENKLVYLLAFPNREARDKSFAEFGADPEWQAVARESERNGKLVDHIESTFLMPVDYAPAVKPSRSPRSRVFELRVYTAAEGRLEDLHARFRAHSLALIKKHGMELIGFWTPVDAKDGAGSKLIYLLAHKDRAAAERSWKAFQSDPRWIRAKAESEASGPLLAAPPQTTFMLPTDYSPTR